MHLGSFIHLKPYEKIIFVARRHLVTFIPMAIFFTLLFIGLPLLVYLLVTKIAPATFGGPAIFPITIMATSIFCLSILLFFYNYFIDFYLDLTIVTNDRLINVRQSSLFARTISEVDLYQIQDAASEIKGFFPTIFNYGNIDLQTAGPQIKFFLEDIHHPHNIRQQILALSSEDKKFHNQ